MPLFLAAGLVWLLTLEWRLSKMVTKEEFDAAFAEYAAAVDAVIVKLQAHPAAADFTDELALLTTAKNNLPTA